MDSVFELTKRVITRTVNKHQNTKEFKDDIKTKLDVFLLNNRITLEEYNILINLL